MITLFNLKKMATINITELESAIRFCDYKIKEYADRQSKLLSMGANRNSNKNAISESAEYTQENKNRLDWFNRKHQLERLMEQKVIAIDEIIK